MIRKAAILLACLSFAIALEGQVITTPESRSALLGGLNATLENVDRPAGSFDGLESPFDPRIPDTPEPVAIQRSLDNVPVKSVSTPLLGDARALSIISEQFKPLGSLVLGTRGILQLGGGRNLEEGESFKAEISGNIYEVRILEVTSRGYTLGMGEARLKKNFLTTKGTAE